MSPKNNICILHTNVHNYLLSTIKSYSNKTLIVSIRIYFLSGTNKNHLLWHWIYFDTGWRLYNPLLLMAKAHKHGYNILSVKVYTFLLMSHFHFWACSIWWTFLRTTKVTALSRILLPNCSKRNINLYTWWIHFILFPLEIQSKD